MIRPTGGLLLAGLLLAGSAAAVELTAQEAAGRRLYREGVGSSGQSVAARVGVQSLLVPAAAVACANCHGVDGKGRPEGGLRPPEITWRELGKPYGHRHDGGREHPAFTAETFHRTLNEGVDPAGQRLNPAMPRFALSRADSAALVAYLQRIEEDRDPGLADGRLRLGTVLPVSGPLAESGRLVEQVLRAALAQANAGGGVHGRQLELVVIDAGGGQPLAERLAAADVFALLGPLVPGGSDELFALAERTGLPVVGPLASTSDGRRYTFRLQGGELEQGRALAEFAGRRLGLSDPPVVVLAAERDAALAVAVQGQLARHGWRQVRQQVSPAAWDAAVADWQRLGVRVLFFFGSPGEFAALQQSAAVAGWPGIVLAPAARAGSAALAGTGPLYLAVPALPGDGTPGGHQAFAELRRAQALPERQPALQAAAYAAATVLLEGLKRAGRVASRERLVDALENLHGFETGVTPAVGFGPGRRVGIMGAHVLSVDPLSRRLQAAGTFVAID